jgi:hypothetical protein
MKKHRVSSDCILPNQVKKKRRVWSSFQEDHTKTFEDGSTEIIDDDLLSLLNIESDSKFALDKNDVSGGPYREFFNEECYLPTFEQEVACSSIAPKPKVIPNSLEAKLIELLKVNNHDSGLKLLKAVGDLDRTRYMSNSKFKHTETPHKEVIRVIINHIDKNQDKDISETFRNLQHIFRDAKDTTK